MRARREPNGELMDALFDLSVDLLGGLNKLGLSLSTKAPAASASVVNFIVAQI